MISCFTRSKRNSAHLPSAIGCKTKLNNETHFLYRIRITRKVNGRQTTNKILPLAKEIDFFPHKLMH